MWEHLLWQLFAHNSMKELFSSKYVNVAVAYFVQIAYSEKFAN